MKNKKIKNSGNVKRCEQIRRDNADRLARLPGESAGAHTPGDMQPQNDVPMRCYRAGPLRTLAGGSSDSFASSSTIKVSSLANPVNPFADIWNETECWLNDEPQPGSTELSLKPEDAHPGKFTEVHHRTLQRRLQE